MPEPDKKFILIVDDSSTNLSVLSQALKTAGYKVRVAVDGESAIASAGKMCDRTRKKPVSRTNIARRANAGNRRL